MANHKWNKNNVCSRCGLHRNMEYFSILMAIVNHPPWEASQRGTKYFYWFPGDKVKTGTRPDCKPN